MERIEQAYDGAQTSYSHGKRTKYITAAHKSSTSINIVYEI